MGTTKSGKRGTAFQAVKEGHGQDARATRPQVLIETWLPAAAIGVECMRERGTGNNPPNARLHVWWARRPLCASRAAVLASLLPADFDRDTFERLLGFGRCVPNWKVLSSQLDGDNGGDSLKAKLEELRRAVSADDRSRQRILIRDLIDRGIQCGGFGCDRAFKERLEDRDLNKLRAALEKVWGQEVVLLDPMAGGGSIPLEATRLGLRTIANEYNPVACSILEATVDYPLRFGTALADKARRWGAIWRERFIDRVGRFFPKSVLSGTARPDGYIFARTVPCPETGFDTPLVPDWHLLKPSRHTRCTERCTFAVPVVDRRAGTWTIRVMQGGRGAGRLATAPPPTYVKGKGYSLFAGRGTAFQAVESRHGQDARATGQGAVIPADYIKAMAQQGRMKSALYAVVIKTKSGLKFAPPGEADLKALAEAEAELKRLRPRWERENIIPTEEIPPGDKTGDPSDKTQSRGNDKPLKRGETHWADMFTPRQLLCMGVLVEELRKLRPEIIEAEGEELGEAVVHLLALAIDKFLNHNCTGTRWENTRRVVKSKMDRHDYAFKCAFAELAPCNAGAGLDWAIDNVLEAYEHLAGLPPTERGSPADITLGSSTSLPDIADGSVTAVVVDPPYDDNVQYSELADFFYVWLKRTQGHRRPEWFSTYLCPREEEAVVNATRFKKDGMKTKQAKEESRRFYRRLMTETFRECRRVLRDDGVLTVMFTHKKQEAWEALFGSLIEAGFCITATWPVKTESEHSLHQAKKNAAQSTVILVARKRGTAFQAVKGHHGQDARATRIGYFDEPMREAIRCKAREAAERLAAEGLNPVDQLVGSFGPAMAVYSQYDEVRTDTGEPVGVEKAIDEASDAVSRWRIERLEARIRELGRQIDLGSQQGLAGVEAEGKFYLLCWDVLGAAEFRFNEARLLGHAVGMDVDQLIQAGLVTRSGDKIVMLPARQRRREKALEPDEVVETLFGPQTKGQRRRRKDVLTIHPNDPQFRTALDACHALALRYVEAGGGSAGIGAAKSLCRRQNWGKDSPVAWLMAALVLVAPEAVRFAKKTRSGKEDPTAVATKYPEFRAWHALLEPLFGIRPPEWKPPKVERGLYGQRLDGVVEPDEEEPDEEESEE